MSSETNQSYSKAWAGRELTITHERRYSDSCPTLQHITVTASDRNPLPITETGYRSHFFYEAETIDPVEMVIEWLDAEAFKPAWRAAQMQRQQLSLFSEL